MPRNNRTKGPKKSDTGTQALAIHKKLAGKIEVRAKVRLTKETLRLFYTPGVGAVSLHLADRPEETGRYTMKKNLVAVVSDGSAVLGLGNIGPEGAYPVMEGKAMLFKALAGIDAVPIVLSTQDPEEIVTTIRSIAPTFGGVNLEDIAAPQCFIIEDILRQELDIPVFHDDQHGTAMVVLAGLYNALRVVGKKAAQARVVINGAGAAGTAIAKLLAGAGFPYITVVDSRGIISGSRTDLSPAKNDLLRFTNTENRSGGLREALEGADIFIGVSHAGLLSADDVRRMASDPIIFALSNPIPEIMPDEAKRGGAAVVATGRSDFPNQVNNALGFPGIFRGALDNGVREITDAMLIAAAKNLAALVRRPAPDAIMPSLFHKGVVPAVAKAIRTPGKKKTQRR